ncbi:hypothetical protein BX666DRAFT_1876909 [Dichotomocladium elegans]|nr:hypothetical protein BX666DRAFT_1876909 [Dichotomocladium elegans]
MCDTDEALARLLQKEEDDSQAQVGVQYEADLALALQLQRQEEDEAAKRAQQHNHRQLEAPDLPPTKDATSITNTVTIVLSDDDEDNSKITESDVALAWQLHQMDHTKDQSADRALAWRIHNENFIAASQEHTCSPPNGEINLQDLINDPTPDIHALFVAFDQMYFDGSLAAVELQWSTRMTLW